MKLTPMNLVSSGLVTIVLGLPAACDRSGDKTAPSQSPSSGTSTSSTSSSSSTTPKADNTERNKTNPPGKTPVDQPVAGEDMNITAAVRRAILDDKSMSVNAQNCKVITEHGVVTLRGPVDSAAEKDAIESKAKAVQGVVSVDNQLEVKK